MLSHDARQALFAGLRDFGDRARRAPSHRQSARELFLGLRLGRGLEALELLSIRSEAILDLAAAVADEAAPDAGTLYAVDGGSTRPIHFENGTVLCAHQSVVSSDPAQLYGDLPLEAYRTVALVSHAHRDDLGASEHLYREDGYLAFVRVHLTRSQVKRKVEEIVQGLAATTEPLHLMRMLERGQLRTGWFLLDGGLYPIGLYYYLIDAESVGREWQRYVHIAHWPPARQLLGQSLRLCEHMQRYERTYVAVVKHPQTRWLLRLGLDEGEQLWANDRQFLKSALADTPGDALSYTSWLVQQEYPAPSAFGDETFDLFSRLSCLQPQLPAADYHVCFFFVYDPRLKTVFRVETPRCILNRWGVDRLRRRLLREMARGSGIPSALRRADSRARIKQAEREALMRQCGLGLDVSFDQSRGAPL